MCEGISTAPPVEVLLHRLLYLLFLVSFLSLPFHIHLPSFNLLPLSAVLLIADSAENVN